MRKLLFYLGIFAIVCSSCIGKKEKEEEQNQDEIADLSAKYKQATDLNDSLLLLMGDVYMGLDSINMQEKLLYNTTGGEGFDRRKEIRDNLDALKQRLAENKAMLDKLQKQVEKSGKETSVQLNTIKQLKAQIENQNRRISELESQLSAANDRIAELNTQVEETQQQLADETEAKEAAQSAAIEAENLANTVYYAIGSNKELKDKGLLEQKFLRSTKVLQGDFDASYFVKADKRTLTSINVNSKKVKIWTNMPEGSYTITGGKDETKTIEITNPQKFWSLSNHLIIQID